MRKIEKDLSEEFGLTKEEIKTIVMFSYAELGRQLYSDGLEYEISGLGVLSVKGNKVMEQALKQKMNPLYPENAKSDIALSLRLKIDRLKEIHNSKPNIKYNE